MQVADYTVNSWCAGAAGGTDSFCEEYGLREKGGGRVSEIFREISEAFDLVAG